MGSVLPLLLLLLLSRGRCVEKKLFSVHPVSENFRPFIWRWFVMRMENFSCRHSLHTFSLSADDFTLLTISHDLMLKSVLFFFSLQIRSLRVVVVHLCSSLNDDLRRLNLVLNSFSVSPMCLSCFLESVSVTVGL